MCNYAFASYPLCLRIDCIQCAHGYAYMLRPLWAWLWSCSIVMPVRCILYVLVVPMHCIHCVLLACFCLGHAHTVYSTQGSLAFSVPLKCALSILEVNFHHCCYVPFMTTFYGHFFLPLPTSNVPLTGRCGVWQTQQVTRFPISKDHKELKRNGAATFHHGWLCVDVF